MIFTINNASYNTDDILYINTAYKVMGYYVIEIYFKTRKRPVVLEYSDKSKYDNSILYLKNNITIVS